MLKKVVLHSVATALASKVLPVPALGEDTRATIVAHYHLGVYSHCLACKVISLVPRPAPFSVT